MKQPSTDLHELIHNMTPTEKAYFKKFSNRHVPGGKNDYVLLFDAIAVQETYDEPALKKKFRNHHFVKRFAQVKHYLSDIVLESLHSYWAGLSPKTEIRKMLLSHEVLYRKGLYGQCKKLLKKARRMAEELEFYPLLLEIIDYETDVFRREANLANMKKYVEEDAQVVNHAIKCLANQAEILYHGVIASTIIFQRGVDRGKEWPARLREIVELPVFATPDYAIDYTSRYYYHSIHGGIQFTLSNWQEAFRHTQAIIENIEEKPGLLKQYFEKYMTMLFNIMRISRFGGDDESFAFYLDKMRKAISKTDLQRHRQTHMMIADFYFVELEMMVARGNTELMESLIHDLESTLQRVASAMPPLRATERYYFIAYGYFILGDFSQALRVVNELLNNPVTKSRQDMYAFTRVLELVLHLEMDNRDYLDYAVRSTYRYLQSKGQLYEVESVLLRFIQRRLPRAVGHEALVAAFTAVKAELEPVLEAGKERSVLHFFDLLAWLESKISGRPFAAVLAANARREMKKAKA